MKRLLAGILTVALMGALLATGLRSSGPGGNPPTTPSDDPATDDGPEARVRSLLADASSGDVAAYLSAFAPEPRARYEREADEAGRATFGEALRASAKARKSHAVFAPEADGPDSARVVVEAVYPDRNERQTYRLERLEGRWLVAGVETLRGHRPPAKFGVPASYNEPEGVPVPLPPPTTEDDSPVE